MLYCKSNKQRGNDMVDELITIEQLERVKRLVQNDCAVLAVQTLTAMIDGRKDRFEQFEHEYEMDDGA
jgi:hypothetical protein